MRAGSLSRARPSPTDGRSDAVAMRKPWSARRSARAEKAESTRTPPFSWCARQGARLYGVQSLPGPRAIVWKSIKYSHASHWPTCTCVGTKPRR
jgi:hypothetical protein